MEGGLRRALQGGPRVEGEGCRGKISRAGLKSPHPRYGHWKAITDLGEGGRRLASGS